MKIQQQHQQEEINKGLPLNNRLRWMVFKAKQRAKANYYEKVVKKPNITDFIESVIQEKAV